MLQALLVAPESQQAAHIADRIAGDDDRSQRLVRPWLSATYQAHLRIRTPLAVSIPLADVPPRSVATPRSHLLLCTCSPATWLLHKQMALDARAWVSSMSRVIRGTGYDLCIRQDDRYYIDIQAWSFHLRQRKDAVWDNLHTCLRTCHTEDSRLCTYKNWIARPPGRHARSLLDLPLSMRCMQRLLRFKKGLSQAAQGH